MRTMSILGELLQDLRYGARVVARQPGTTLIIVISLALGIGANTMVFSLVNAILLRSLPYPEPDRLVQMWPTPPNRPNQRSRFNATICMDLYGVMSHSVAQRRQEIGIRVAFGATARNVLASVLGRGLIVIGTGMAIGLAASLMLTRIIAGALWGVTATDPATYTVVLLTIFVVAGLACYVPARRALKVDPLVAMRQE